MFLDLKPVMARDYLVSIEKPREWFASENFEFFSSEVIAIAGLNLMQPGFAPDIAKALYSELHPFESSLWRTLRYDALDHPHVTGPIIVPPRVERLFGLSDTPSPFFWRKSDQGPICSEWGARTVRPRQLVLGPPSPRGITFRDVREKLFSVLKIPYPIYNSIHDYTPEPFVVVNPINKDFRAVKGRYFALLCLKGRFLFETHQQDVNLDTYTLTKALSEGDFVSGIAEIWIRVTPKRGRAMSILIVQ